MIFETVILTGTIILEYLVYSIAIRKDFAKLFGYVFLMNLFTWPLAQIIPLNFLIVEIFVFLSESILSKYLLRLPLWKAILISLIANSFSAFVGIFILKI